jgi:hypothetical protein
MKIGITSVTCVLLLTACGGGGKSTDKATAAQVKEIRTARIVPSIEGLTCKSGSTASTTDAAGQFAIEENYVDCSIGGFKLPTLPRVPTARVYHTETNAGKTISREYEIITYTPNFFGQGNVPANVTRFLTMIKSGGTSVSSEIRAANWTRFNDGFDWNTGDLGTAIASIQSDAQSLDGTAHALPSAEEGISTANAVWQCAQTGQYTGELNGNLYMDSKATDRSSRTSATIGVLIMPPFGSLAGNLSFQNAEGENFLRGNFGFEFLDGFPTSAATISPTVVHYLGYDAEDPPTAKINLSLSLNPEVHEIEGALLGVGERAPSGTLTSVDRETTNTAPTYVFLHYPVTYLHRQGYFITQVLYIEIDAVDNVRGYLSNYTSLTRDMPMTGNVAPDNFLSASRGNIKVEGQFDRDAVTLYASVYQGSDLLTQVLLTGCPL